MNKQELKKRILKAYSKGASEPQLRKYVGLYDLYHLVRTEERQKARAEHGKVIKEIFN